METTMNRDGYSPWAEYARLQKISAKLTRCDDLEFALDAALERILDEASTPQQAGQAIEVKRVMASASRRYRHRRRLAQTYLQPISPSSFDRPFDATLDLNGIAAKVGVLNAALLFDAAMGYSGREIARRRGVAPGAARVRIVRARSRLAA
jgi:hypothetical protein